MAEPTTRTPDSREAAAILLMLLGDEEAAEVLSRLDPAEVQHVLPPEVLQQVGDLGFRVRVVTAHEHRVLPTADTSRVDHHRRSHRIEGLDDPGTREGALDLLGERVGVRHEQRRRHPVREVERVRDVDQDLPVEVVLAGCLQRLEGPRAVGGVHDDLGPSGDLLEGRHPDVRMIGLPDGEGGIPHVIGLRALRERRRVAGPDRHVVPELRQLARDGPSHDPRPEHPDAHAMMLTVEGSPAPGDRAE